MSAASFLLFQIAAVHRRCIGLIATSARKAATVSTSSVVEETATQNEAINRIIDEMTEKDSVPEILHKKDVVVSNILSSNSVDALNKVFKSLKKPISSAAASAFLKKLSIIKHFNTTYEKEGLSFLNDVNRNLLGEIGSALRHRMPAVAALDSITSLLTLGIDSGDLFESVLSSLKEELLSTTPDISIKCLVKFSNASRNKKYRLPDDLKILIDNIVQLKTSEISEPREALGLMANFNISDAWHSSLLHRTKELLPLMNSGELVSLMEQLAIRKKFGRDILPLIAAALSTGPAVLTVNQIALLVTAIAKLDFIDARLLRKIAQDVVINSPSLKKWSQVSLIVGTFAKLHYSHEKLWDCLASWINANYTKASVADLSRTISACAVCGKGHLITIAAKYLAGQLNIEKTPTVFIWLNTIHSLAVCDTLTPKLAETVLRKEFIEQFLKLENFGSKVFNLSRIAQVQAYVNCCLKDYRGVSMKLETYLGVDKQTNETAAIIKYGQKGLYDAQCFLNVLYKLAPLESHCVGPFLSADGFYVEAIVQIDASSRFVPTTRFKNDKRPFLAVIYLSPKQLTMTCDPNDEAQPLGSVALGLKLLQKRGLIPVTFTKLEMESKKLLTQRIEFIRGKLLEAVNKLK